MKAKRFYLILYTKALRALMVLTFNLHFCTLAGHYLCLIEKKILSIDNKWLSDSVLKPLFL